MVPSGNKTVVKTKLHIYLGTSATIGSDRRSIKYLNVNETLWYRRGRTISHVSVTGASSREFALYSLELVELLYTEVNATF